MYYPGNLIPFQMVPNHYHYNDLYMFNQNHFEVDFAAKLYQYDPSFYFADGYRTMRVNNNIVSAHQTINRTVKSKKPRSDWCSNCNNETFRRKNEMSLEKSAHLMTDNFKLSNTMSKKDKMEIMRVKTDTLNKNFRSKSLNTGHDKTTDSKQCRPIDESCEKKERISRIDKFEKKIEHKFVAVEESRKQVETNKVLPASINMPPPPPPPLPTDLNLLKTKPNLNLNRFNRGGNKSVANGDQNSANSFDAVVNELKFRLNKIKPSEENENLDEKMPKLILTERRKPGESNGKPIETGLSILEEIDSGIQSTDTIGKNLQVNSDSSLSSAQSQSSKQSSLNRLKSLSKSNIGVSGIFKKNKPSSENVYINTDCNSSRFSESLSKQSDNKTDLSSLSDFTDSIKCETVNDTEPQSSIKKSSTQNLNLKGKKVIFEKIENQQVLDKNKKIHKRNTFSEAKKSNLKDLSQKKIDEKPFINRLVKSKSDYINVNNSCLDRETQSSYDTFDLIKIESLGDLSNKQNFITAFSTRNFFQNDKSKEDNSKIESSVKFEREFKKNSQPVYASTTLKSKSEIKINKNKQMSIVRPIAKSVFSYHTLKPNQFKSNNENSSDSLKDSLQEKNKNQIPSKYSSFVDLKKNNNHLTQKNFNSLNRKNSKDLCSNLINKATEYGIELPDLLGKFAQNYSIQNEELIKNQNYDQIQFLKGIENFNQYSFSDFDDQYNEFDQYLELMSSF